MYCRKINSTDLQITGSADQKELDKIKPGEIVKVTIKKGRNLLHHRKFFALANVVFNNSEGFKSVEQLLYATKKSLGYVEDQILFTGEVVENVKSISFEKMDQIEFGEFYTGAVKLWADFLQITDEELESESE